MAKVESKSAQQALDMMLSAIGKREVDFKEKVTILGKDPVLASRHRFGELTWHSVKPTAPDFELSSIFWER